MNNPLEGRLVGALMDAISGDSFDIAVTSDDERGRALLITVWADTAEACAVGVFGLDAAQEIHDYLDEALACLQTDTNTDPKETS